MPKYRSKKPNSKIALEVYRCGNTHWHFVPHKSDNSTHPPWYRSTSYVDEGKFNSFEEVYVQGHGSQRFTVDHKYESDFYALRDDRGEKLWCMGRYERKDWMIYREEELSKTPWAGADGKPPAYDS